MGSMPTRFTKTAMILPCPCCRDGWVEVVDEHGRYFRRCVCWHMKKVDEAVRRGIPRDAALRHQAARVRMYEPVVART